jgi:hypothetical protein
MALSPTALIRAHPAQSAGRATAQSAEQTRENANTIMGLVGQRRQLVGEIEDLQQRRLELTQALPTKSGSERATYEATLREINQQMAGAQVALRSIDGTIANLQGSQLTAPSLAPAAPPAPMPAPSGSLLDPPLPPAPDSPSWSFGVNYAAALGVSVALLFAMGLLFARRLRRDTSNAIEGLRADLHRAIHGVEAMAVEVERIGEGQRFVTKSLAEKQGAEVPRSR